MKTLVVYYSRTGTTKIVALKISEILSCETQEIIDYKDRSGILGWLYSGRDAFFRYLTEIKPIDKDLSYYDNVIIGTPVWAGNIAPAIRTFVKNYSEKFNNVTFFCTMAASGSKKVFKELESLCNKKPLATLELSRKEILSGNYVEKIKSCFLE